MVTLIKTRFALAGEHAALTAAQTLTATLQDQADTAARIHMAVKEKHARIRNFEKEIVGCFISIFFSQALFLITCLSSLP